MQRFTILAVLVLISACQAPNQQAYPTVGAFAPGEISRFVFSDWAGPDIPVWAYVPADTDVSTAPILVIMHGMKRAPARYLREWQPLAQQNGIVVIAPEFSSEDFPKSAGYNLGNVFRSEAIDLQDESLWSFSVIEPLFEQVVGSLDSTQSEYTLFGHSAGSQFVHRFLYYKPEARVKRYIAANAGWYTLPDLDVPYPYGLDGAAVSEEAVVAALAKDVVVLLGDQDNDPEHDSLRRTPEAMRQGEHRFARGLHFHETGERQSQRFNVRSGWQVVVVEGVAHSNAGMAAGAIPYIE